jgi:hypothetical protein
LQRSELDRKRKHHNSPNSRYADHRPGVHTLTKRWSQPLPSALD